MPYEKFKFENIERLYPEAGNLMWEPMLMWSLPTNKKDKLKEICDAGDYFASLKKDGACYQFIKTNHYEYLFGRTISTKTGLLTEKISNVPHIQKALSILPANTVLVLEIYYPGKTSKDTTAIMGCLPSKAIERQKNNPIHAYCHDLLYYDGQDYREMPAIERYKVLQQIWEKFNLNQYKFLELAQPIYENIYEKLAEALAAGEEGFVLRKKDSVWQCGKRPAWATIKCKQMDTIDLVCTRAIEATKEYTGKELETWPYWQERSERDQNGEYTWLSSEGQYYEDYLHNPHIYRPVTKPYFYGWKTAIGIGAYDDEGNLKEIGTVSSGLTDEMRAHLDDYVGKVVALQCMSIDRKEKTLRHPIVKAWRDDKNAAECKLSEVFH